jgi:phosphotransferase system  glucose/maltose/N-acetylglucosamine-specific IIC component
LPVLLIIAAGIVVGIFWVDHQLKRVKLEEWRNTLNEGFSGALKLLQGLNWDGVFDDIRTSKIAYAFHVFIKVAGYWIVTMIILFFPYGFGLSLIHTDANLYLLAFISLVLVLFLSKKDLEKKYRQVTSLDTLLWELRWFNSEFKSAEFQT